MRTPHPAAWWLFGATVLAALVLRRRLGDEILLARYTGYVMPWLLLLLVPGTVMAWLGRRPILGAVLGAAAAFVVLEEAHLFRPRVIDPAAPTALTLRVMSHNTWYRNDDAARLARIVLRYRPDVLLLQEISPEVLAALEDELRRQGLYEGGAVHAAYEPELLQAVIGRYPIASSTGKRRRGNAQRVVLRTPEGSITIFNVHPPRWPGWRRRYSEIAALLDEDVAREAGPVILGGDLNAPDHSQLYGLLASRLANAHEVAGWGFGFTFPASLGWRRHVVPAVPLVRIDHVFVSSHFVTLRAGTLPDAGGSDHRPVFAELALRAPEGEPQGSAARGPPVTSSDG